MTVSDISFALAIAALVISLLHVLLAFRAPDVAENRTLRTHVLYHDRPWQSIELYARGAGVFEATVWRRDVERGDIVLVPHATSLAYRVIDVRYAGRYGARAVLRALTSEQLVRSGLLRDQGFSWALAEVVAGPATAAL